MAGSLDWILMGYRLPREPSTVRVTVWRKLRRLGVAQIVDGLVVLPADARTREQLGWLADDVLKAGGEATVWIGRLESRSMERNIASKMAGAVAAEYRTTQAAASAALSEPIPNRHRTALRLRRELRRVGRRDFFPPPQRHEARAAVEALLSSIEVTT